MGQDISATVLARLEQARLARLATLDPKGYPLVLPVCFVFDGSCFHTPVDRKPKRVSADRLGRLRNIRANPRVTLLIDEYREDWSQLWYVLVRGKAAQIPEENDEERSRALGLLKDKYPQYAAGLLPEDAPIIRVVPEHIHSWGRV